MKIKVIEISFEGKVGYLKELSIFSAESVVDNPVNAKHYTDDNELKSDLRSIYYTGVGGGKSCVRADSSQVVEFEMQLIELSRKPVELGMQATFSLFTTN